MKKFLRYWFIYFISLKLISEIVPVFVFSKGNETILVVAAVFTFFEFFLKPLVKFLLLPLNLLTLGLTRWVVNVIGLYLTTLLVADFALSPYNFPGGSWGGFVAPPIKLSLITTYILVSFVLNLSFSLIRWLLKK